MKRAGSNNHEHGSTLMCVLAIIAIVSMIGAGVLSNSTTRYNATARQVKGWKEALYAAEAGGDIGYAECRKAITDPSNLFTTAHGWTQTNTAPKTWTKSIPAFGPDGAFTSTVT